MARSDLAKFLRLDRGNNESSSDPMVFDIRGKNGGPGYCFRTPQSPMVSVGALEDLAGVSASEAEFNSKLGQVLLINMRNGGKFNLLDSIIEDFLAGR